MSILFASPNWSKYERYLRQSFRENKLNFNEVTTNLQTDQTEVEFIICEPTDYVKDFSSFIKAKAVLSLWAGVDNLIKNKTLDKPIVRLVDDGMKQGMIEWCLAHVLRHHLGIDTHIKNQDGVWRSQIIPPLANEITVGVLGLGALGSAVAVALASIGFNVTGWSRTEKNIANVKTFSGTGNLNQVLKEAHILITLLPLTTETKYILNDTTLNQLPKKSIIINPGRGLLIDDNALLKSLNSGHIRHATLDVFSREPLTSSHFYWTHPNVTVTPHIAAHTRPHSSANTITKSIIKLRRGEIPVGLVNKEKMY